MLRTIKAFSVILFILVFSSCERVLFEPTPEYSATGLFSEYLDLVQEKHAMLEFKKVDVRALRDSILPTISENISSEDLFDKLAFVTAQLRDGHSALRSDVKEYTYDFTSAYPTAFHVGILAENYLGPAVAKKIKTIKGGEAGIKVVYGFLPQSDEIGYIWVPSWQTELDDEQIDSVFFEVKDAKALIIDIRQNTGGDPSLATKFASYLTDKTVYTGFERFKTGPKEGDFSDSKVYLIPASSPYKFLKPVAVLTDRYCYSASTTFAYSVNPLEQVTFIGQRTGGGSGSVADGYLSNGWYWSLSTSEFIDHLGNHLDDGFDPDISVALDTLDKTQDEIIQRALFELQ